MADTPESGWSRPSRSISREDAVAPGRATTQMHLITDDQALPALEEAMADSLDVIDRMLAQAGLELAQRPMQAAIEVVALCIDEVDAGDGTGPRPSGTFPDYATNKWFRMIYRIVDDWYRTRFGEAMEREARGTRLAATLIRDTPIPWPCR